MDRVTKCWDVHLVAYLLSKGFVEVSLPKREHQYVYFYFKATPELDQETLNFYTGKSEVNAQTFSGYLRRLTIAVGEMRKGRLTE